MKKILIISNNSHIEIGCIEVYSKKIINLFLDNNYQVFEFASINKNNISKLNKRPNYHFILNDFLQQENSKKNFFLKLYKFFY